MNVNEQINQIRNSQCNSCPDLVAVRKKIVVSRGNPDADTVIVGQNPGATEDEKGVPFSGPAGQLLDQIIELAGFNPNEDFFFTNVVMCHTQNNIEPSRTHINNCSKHVQSITGNFRKFIAIGRTAAVGLCTSYFPEKVGQINMAVGMKDIITKGTPYSMRGDKMLFVTYHTSYLLRMNLNASSIDNPFFQAVKNEIIAAKRMRAIPSNGLKFQVAGGIF